MSLFDVIKYGDTDLGVEEELKGLPIELFNLYWHLEKLDGEHHRHIENRAWYITYRYRWASPDRLVLMRQIFNKALKEYDEPL